MPEKPAGLIARQYGVADDVRYLMVCELWDTSVPGCPFVFIQYIDGKPQYIHDEPEGTQ